MPARRGPAPGLPRRLCLLLAAVLLTLAGDGARGAVTDASPTPPFRAQVRDEATGLRAEASSKSPRIAELGAGTWVEVRACVPDCLDAQAWAELEEGGFLRLEALAPAHEGLGLAPGEAVGGGPGLGVGAPYWGAVRRGGAEILQAPDEGAGLLERAKSGVTLAFLREPLLEARGWLMRQSGGYVRAADVHEFEPTPLRGEAHPAGPLAFLWRMAPLTLDSHGDDPLDPVVVLPAYTRLEVQSVEGDRVRVEGGWLPREDVAIAFARPRPPEVPEGARWVHVDLAENVLTAYEGDRWVYATLISSGAPLPTLDSDEGIFRVWSKRRSSHMSDPGEYDVEGVPDVLFYNRGEALHGSFWHASFGEAVSHGCINLSLEDAAWLFAWAPPDLPPGWAWRNPQPQDDALWVQVEYAVPFGDGLPVGERPIEVHGP